MTDLRYGLRTLARTPGFAAVAVLTLALGLGANTAIFTIFDSILLRPLPYRDPGRLTAVQMVVPRFAHLAPNLPMNAASFVRFRKLAHSFEQMAMFDEQKVNLTSGGDPVRVTMSRASASLFGLLGVQPQIGRTFTEQEDQAGRDDVVVLSDRLWRERFHGDASIAGRKILLDGRPYEVIGVMPPGFQVPRTSQLQATLFTDDYAQLWKPFGLQDSEIDPLGDFDFGCIARLKAGVLPPQAKAELDLIEAGIIQELPANLHVEVLTAVVPLEEQIAGRPREGLIVLLASVGAVLLIVCVNIANLMLVRAAGRRREMAIRTALGAPAGRLIRQTLAESLILAVAGGALGSALAWWALGTLLARAPVDLPRISEIGMDWRVAAFTFAATLACAGFCGILPAWRGAGADPQSALKSGSQTITESRRGRAVRHALIAAEVALSAMCLAVGGLLLHSFVNLMRVDKGFEAGRALTVNVVLPRTRYPKQEDRARFVRSLLESVRNQPGVLVVGESNMLPLSGEGNNNLVEAEGTQVPLPERPLADMRSASPDFLRAMGIPLLAGRMFQESDAEHRVAVVSAGLARRLWPNADPIGRRFHEGDNKEQWVEVVGVVGNVRGASLQKAPSPTAYLPYWQRSQRDVNLVVRTGMDAAGVTAAVRRAIQRLDRELPIARFETIDGLVDDSVAQQRFQMDLVLLFAAAALLAAGLGVYGVVAQSVAQRTNEIGIRMALGASEGSVWRLVLAQGMAPVAAGLVLGLAASLAGGRLVGNLLFGVPGADPAVLMAVTVVLLAAGAAACALPARRATRVDPLVALRYE